eukprot:TRINITY_DN282_c0_g2_i1.p1 TRINITY_DN282_c0_g2~~TRINITY_DN282_c0_g2_i1.p1  ORF type:complete len:219 (-),score=48.70 TRINITY_DN282_c0_g2_i1:122-778(-)
MRVLVIGGSGATGRPLVKQLLALPEVSHLSLLGRKIYDGFPESDKLHQHVVDFTNIAEVSKDPTFLNEYDVAYSTLGTTRAQAGSGEAFYLVDYTYTVNFATLAKKLGVKKFHLLTSRRSDASSWFLFPRTKGQCEEQVKKLDFDYVSIWQPGILERENTDRFFEKIANAIISSLPTAKLGKVMANVGIQSTPPASEKVTYFSDSEIWKMADALPEEN